MRWVLRLSRAHKAQCRLRPRAPAVFGWTIGNENGRKQAGGNKHLSAWQEGKHKHPIRSEAWVVISFHKRILYYCPYCFHDQISKEEGNVAPSIHSD